MPGPPLDLRLLPAAAACWCACLLGVRLPPRTGAGLAVAALVVACAALTARSAAGPGTVGPGATGTGSGQDPPDRVVLRGHAVLVLLVVAAALASSASQRAVRDAGLLGALVGDGAQARVVGTVRSEAVPIRSSAPWDDDDGGRVRVQLAVEHVTGHGRSGPAAAPVLVLAGRGWQDVAYGSRVEAFGTLVPTGPGDSARAALVVRAPPIAHRAPGALDRAVRGMRQASLRVSDGLPPDPRGLVPGAAIGDTSRVPADLDSAMRVAGLTHVTAVSGAHFAVVGAVVLGLTALLGLPRTARAVVVGLAMAGFVVLVHPAPSVLRAAVTGAVGVAALVLGRPSRAVPALGACVLVLLVADPWLAGSIGFALSVTATAGIVLGTGPLARALTPLVPVRVARVVAVPVAAQCACAPVVALLAPGVATYAVPANLAAAPAVAPATVLGVLATLLAPWWPDGATACTTAAGWATTWIAVVARTAAGLPGATVPWPAPPWGPVLLAVATAGAGLAVARPWRGDRGP